MTGRLFIIASLLLSQTAAASLALEELPPAFVTQVRSGEVQMAVSDDRLSPYVSNQTLEAYAFERGGVAMVLVAYTALPGSQWGFLGPLSGTVFVEAPRLYEGGTAQFTLYFDQLVPGIQDTFWSGQPQTSLVLQPDAMNAGFGIYEFSGKPDYAGSGNMAFATESDEPITCIECRYSARFELVSLNYSSGMLQFDPDDPRSLLFRILFYSYDGDGVSSRDLVVDYDAASNDVDSDGVPDSTDNCLFAANPTQLDVDGDGIGNYCDADFNNDCLVNFADLGMLWAAFMGQDPLFDLDGSGRTDIVDLFLTRPMFLRPPGPGAPGNLCWQQ